MTTTPLPVEPSTELLGRLRQYVNADATADAYLTSCWGTAAELVNTYVGTSSVPAPVLQRAALDVASELFHRRNAPGGVMQQFTDVGAAPVRMARDPMLGAYPILAPYVGGGFG